ncbi:MULTISPECIES: universal stress protein [Streptomyces]|uniref:universal stress protein n=1 Tax=Streptomyces TaxID=1883 RepID=UPI00205CC65D|nr:MULTISPECIES: universal stress protein [Streptomyces]UPT40118.1 universal stress protein [Streptomyces sp. WAC00303]WIY74409.1 universal stress protein [Streptomyces anulatus]
MTSTTSAPVTLGAVVVGVDASAPARAAALWAAEEADRRGRPLHIVHAADTDHRMLYAGVEAIQAILEAGRDLLTDTAEAVSDRYPGLIVTKELSRIDPVGGLRAAAGERGTIVVGSRGLGGFGALMLGSVGLGLAARNEAPVIVVRGELDRATTGVVTAAVHGASDLGWLMLAAAEAQARKASLRLLSVCDVLAQVGTVTTMLDSLGEVAKQQVHEVTAMAGRTGEAYPDLTVTHHVETGTSVPGILVEASKHTDLMVLGSRRHLLGLGPALGRVSHAVLHHGHCPVEIVPPEYVDPADQR